MSDRTLLFVSAFVPEMTNSGASMRAASQLIALSQSFDVTLAIVGQEYAERDGEPSLTTEIRAACSSVIVVQQTAAVERLLRRLRWAQMRLFLEAVWPLPRAFIQTEPALKALSTQLAGRHFDVVHCFHLATGRLARLLKRSGIDVERTVLDLYDYESAARFRAIRPFATRLGKQMVIAQLLDAAKWAAKETSLIPAFDDVCICSETDLAKLRHRFPRSRWHVVPNIVPAPVRFVATEHDRFTFMYVGSFGYFPNVDAVNFLCENVVPILRGQASSPFRILIVGRNAKALAKLTALEGVEIVDSPADLAPYYAQADVAIVPLRAGGGTRIKILEAFSYGLPVVSTTIGAEGLEVTPGADILIGDDAAAFAGECRRIWADETLRRRIATAGRDLWQRKYTPDALREALAATYQNAAANADREHPEDLP